MKVLAVLLLFVAVAASYKLQDEHEREKRFLFGDCKADSDCGADKCCLSSIDYCYDKLDLDDFCSVSLCGCKDGLSCQATHQIGSVNVYHRCRPVPTEAPGSGDLS
ncbi:hypothetical protein OS493_027501 [Desmophyllum pertusum]|uniref:Uncharacterized protein n=1 Tax=Desmophyllum pertusum TaxID=174260 RepID=A0A9W9Y9E5_9CNID|nr:hypothetical protein OS493_027501 [Desmophyllum pertusum]